MSSSPHRAVDRSPARVSSMLAVVAGVVAVVATAFSGLALASGVGGLVCLAAGVRRGSRRALGIGTAGLFGGVLLAGLAGAPTAALLLAAVGVVIAWDVGENAITVGERMGDIAATQRAEIVHVSMSVIIGALAAAGGYLVYWVSTEGQPTAALVALLFAVVLLTAVLRR